MRTFGQAIFIAKRAHPNEDLVSWRSYVSSAFLNLSVHPIYQLRQVVKINGILCLIYHLVFGNQASPCCWCSVSGLMCWIWIKKYNISDLHVYMGNFFSWALTQDLITYKGTLRPRLQACLLMFWDEIGCPWKATKQEFGKELKIIGFFIDINHGTLTLTNKSISNILDTVKSFLASPE